MSDTAILPAYRGPKPEDKAPAPSKPPARWQRVLRGGSRAQLDTEFTGKTGRAARTRILLCPVEVVEPESLGAAPGKFPGRLVSTIPGEKVYGTIVERF